jgi:hypothetical protein
MFGKKQSIESKIKNSESNKGSNSYLYGKRENYILGTKILLVIFIKLQL